MRIGLISDTHGLLRPQAVEALAGAEALLHAGDVGKAAVLDELSTLAPLYAIRGNVDRVGPTADLPETLLVELGGRRLWLVHDGKGAEPPEGVEVVICGHSHQPRVEERQGVLWVNPGSAGPRRFRLPVSVGWLELGERVEARIVELDVG